MLTIDLLRHASAAAAASAGSWPATLEPLLTGPGAFVLLAAIGLLGLMLAFNLQLRELIAPFTGAARWVGSTTADSMRRAQEARGADAGAASGHQRRGEGRRAAGQASPIAVPMATPLDDGRAAASSTSPRHGPASRR